jgi:hypothetical protein
MRHVLTPSWEPAKDYSPNSNLYLADNSRGLSTQSVSHAASPNLLPRPEDRFPSPAGAGGGRHILETETGSDLASVLKPIRRAESGEVSPMSSVAGQKFPRNAELQIYDQSPWWGRAAGFFALGLIGLAAVVPIITLMQSLARGDSIGVPLFIGLTAVFGSFFVFGLAAALNKPYLLVSPQSDSVERGNELFKRRFLRRKVLCANLKGVIVGAQTQAINTGLVGSLLASQLSLSGAFRILKISSMELGLGFQVSIPITLRQRAQLIQLLIRLESLMFHPHANMSEYCEEKNFVGKGRSRMDPRCSKVAIENKQ